ncbi:hypothetical protein HDU81_009788 [Chytriomyces hyalinus]|nr:hypothetical protein HDU81_009788 [Chytriomyces hyalinus]
MDAEECSFHFSIDSFLLYKSFNVSKKSLVVKYISGAILIHRFAWAAVDLTRIGSYWDPIQQTCHHLQDKVSYTGFLTADLATSCASFILCLAFDVQHWDMFSSLWDVVQRVTAKNVIRSLVVLVVNAEVLAFAVSLIEHEPFLAALLFLVRVLVHTQAVNAEIYSRKAVDVGGGSVIASYFVKTEDSDSSRS